MSVTTITTRLRTADPLAGFRSRAARHAAEDGLLDAAARAVGDEPLVSPFLLANARDERTRRAVDTDLARHLAVETWRASRARLIARGGEGRWLSAIPAAQEMLRELVTQHVLEDDIAAARTEAFAVDLLATVYRRALHLLGARLADAILAPRVPGAVDADGRPGTWLRVSDEIGRAL